MTTRTYNPSLDRTDVARRWFGSSVTAPELGRAHVLVRPAAEPVVVWHGQPLPSARIGEHRRYVIDVAKHGIAFEVEAASAEAVFPFAVTVELTCRVLDPYAIAHDNIQDMTAALKPWLVREVRDTAARFDKLRPTEAARAIEARLGSAHPSREVELTGYSVAVTPLNTQGVVAAKQEMTVQGMWREEMREVSHGGLEERLGQLLATNNGDVRAALEYLANQRDTEAQFVLKALQIAKGGDMEDVDLADLHRLALGKFISGNGDDAGGKQETMRERLERRNKMEGGRVVEGGVSSTAGKPAADRSGNGAEPVPPATS